MTYLASVAGNDRQHTFRTCSRSFEVRSSSARLQIAESRHKAAFVLNDGLFRRPKQCSSVSLQSFDSSAG